MICLATSTSDAQKFFKIVDATKQSWSGGLPQNGSGTTYSVIVVLKTDMKIEFKDFWLGNDYGIPDISSLSYSDGRALKKGDTAVVKYTVHHYPPNSPMADESRTIVKPAPIYYSGQALLGFSVAGSAPVYRAVKSFRELPAKKAIQ